MKLLFYSPMSWPHLAKPCATFPHSNEYFDADKGCELYRESLNLLRLAEEVGFDWIGVGEEHMNAYGVVPNPCLIAAALAPVTRHAMLCVLGNPLPLLNPLRVAEEYAMIDMLSNGRLVAGFPRGVPQNYQAYGLSAEHSKEQLAEGIRFVLDAWERKGPFDWHGKHYQFNNVSIWPQPRQRPELVMSCKSADSVQLAVKYRAVMGEVYVKTEAVLTHFIRNMATYKSLASAEGWTATPDRFLLSVPCVVAGSTAKAVERARRAWQYARHVIAGSFENAKESLRESYYRDVAHLLPSGTETAEQQMRYGGVICGDPAAVIDQIQNLKAKADVGVLGLQMQWGNLSPAEVRESLDLFGRYVRASIT